MESILESKPSKIGLDLTASMASNAKHWQSIASQVFSNRRNAGCPSVERLATLLNIAVNAALPKSACNTIQNGPRIVCL